MGADLEEPSDSSREDIIHYHLGALAMAGAPPYSNGYFRHQSKGVRKIIEATSRSQHTQYESLLYVLIPASVTLLALPEIMGEEVAMIQRITTRVLDEAKGIDNSLMNGCIGEIVNEEFGRRRKLSKFFTTRFRIDPSAETHQYDGDFILPEGFYQLSFSQASRIVGCIFRLLEERVR